MHEEIIFAGFGGQGILFAAQLLVHAGMMAGKEVAWVPSYGPEMRGGTAYAAAIIADEPIGSLVVSAPTVAAVMNQPSLEKYEPTVRHGGILIVNRSLIRGHVHRGDLTVIEVSANEIAIAIGDDLLANMVVLGAVVGATAVVPLETLLAALKKIVHEHRAQLLEGDEAAIRRGMTIASDALIPIGASGF